MEIWNEERDALWRRVIEEKIGTNGMVGAQN